MNSRPDERSIVKTEKVIEFPIIFHVLIRPKLFTFTATRCLAQINSFWHRLGELRPIRKMSDREIDGNE